MRKKASLALAADSSGCDCDFGSRSKRFPVRRLLAMLELGGLGSTRVGSRVSSIALSSFEGIIVSNARALLGIGDHNIG